MDIYTTYWLIIYFIFGSILGSFFNVVGLRIPRNTFLSQRRSYCPVCQQQLRWFELIPIVSFFLQNGKCRQCQHKISFLYPIIEVTTGLLFSFCFWKIGHTLELITALIFISMLMIILVTDVVYMLIPDRILLFFLPLILIMRILSPLDPWYDTFIGAIIGFLLLAVIVIVSKGGMGGGDVKLFAVLGFVLGWQGTLLTLFLASFIGAIIGAILIGVNKMNRKQPIPFGPFIIIAAIISYFFGDNMLVAYSTFF